MIDILLAVYNGEKYLASQLNSIFEQSYKDFRLIIFDDGSTDAGYAIIERYIKEYNNILYIKSEKNSGSPVFSFSKLLGFSKADYIAFCDQDDVWQKDKLAISLEKMVWLEKKFFGSAVMVYSDLFVVDENLKIISKSFMKFQKLPRKLKKIQNLIVQNNITACSMMINRKLAEICGQIPKEALMHDWWIALVAVFFGNSYYIDKPTVYYRQHRKNSVGAKNVENLGYIVRKIFDRKNIKKNIDLTYIQSEAFLKKYENLLTSKQKKILKDYIEIKGCSKLKKILKLTSGGYLKNGILRKFGQIFYI